MVEKVVQVQQRRGRAERGHDPLRDDAVQPRDVGAHAAGEPPDARPPRHSACQPAASQRSDRQLVDAHAERARGVRHSALAGDRELELDSLGRQSGAEPQQRALGAAGLGRLRDGEYA